MSAVIGWTLAAGALLVGWFGYGWRGLVLALTVLAFWLLLQFSRTLRVLRGAIGERDGHRSAAFLPASAAASLPPYFFR